MNTFLVMSLSGTSMLIIYFIISKILVREISVEFKYVLLRFSLLYFLVPLPFAKTIYSDFFVYLFGIQPYRGMGVVFNEFSTSFAGRGNVAINAIYKYALALIIIWCLGAVIMLVRELRKYWYQKRQILKRSMWVEEPDRLKRWKAIQKEYGIKRKVLFSVCAVNISPLTFGVLKPEVVLPENLAEDAEETVIRHELVHIKQFDVLMRILTIFTVSLHWFNPFIYLLRNELYRQCELVCDEKAVQGIDMTLRHVFATAILDNSVIISTKKTTKEEKLLVGLSKEGEKIEERVHRIMKVQEERSKKHVLLMSLVVVFAVLVNSLTVLAYDDVKKVNVEQEQADLTEFSQFGWRYERGCTGSGEVEIIFEAQFVDKDGNIYPAGEGVQPRGIFCKHIYEPGYFSTHKPATGSTCIVTCYNAENCVKCGVINVYGWHCTTTYTPCRHDI